MHDELRYAVRHGLMQDLGEGDGHRSATPPDQTALPMRQLGSFLPGDRLGGAGVHWNGQTWRFLPPTSSCAATIEQRYGKNFMPAGADDPGLGRHLRRARAVLRPLRVPAAASAARPATSRADPAGRQSVRGAARARLPEPADQAAPTSARCSRSAARIWATSPFQVPSANMTAALHQPGRRAPRAVHVLRLLRALRLRALSPSRARRRHCCRSCCSRRTSSCAPAPTCCGST